MASSVAVARWHRYGPLHDANPERGDERHPRPPRRIRIRGPDDDAARRQRIGGGGIGGSFPSDAFWCRIKTPQPYGILCPGLWCGRLLERTDAARGRRAASPPARQELRCTIIITDRRT